METTRAVDDRPVAAGDRERGPREGFGEERHRHLGLCLRLENPTDGSHHALLECHVGERTGAAQAEGPLVRRLQGNEQARETGVEQGVDELVAKRRPLVVTQVSRPR